MTHRTTALIPSEKVCTDEQMLKKGVFPVNGLTFEILVNLFSLYIDPA